MTYNGGSAQTISWLANGTDQAPINTSHVRISLSVDGGLTFPIVLSESTPNDDSHQVIIPNINTTKARIKVEAVEYRQEEVVQYLKLNLIPLLLGIHWLLLLYQL